MKMNTETYEATHGRKPSGNGGWMFEITGSDGAGAYTTETVEAIGTLTEAKKSALKDFRAMDSRIKRITEIVVLP